MSEDQLHDDGGIFHHPRTQGEFFDSHQYLVDFYIRHNAEPAMNAVLYLLPNLVARIPKCHRLLDVGSGPTVHVSMVFRNKVDEVYLSDFSPSNRAELMKWWKGESSFDWSDVAQFIAQMEQGHSRSDTWMEMEAEGRRIMKGALDCDVLQEGVISDARLAAEKFDVVTTFFCLEAATTNAEEYKRALSNVANLVKNGGYLIMGGIMGAPHYTTGGRHIRCHALSEMELKADLRSVGLYVSSGGSSFYDHNGIFIFMGRKEVDEEGIFLCASNQA